MIEKLYDKVSNIQEINETAAKLRRIGLVDELKNLADKYQVPELDQNEFLFGKRFFLIDGGDTRKEYETARSKLLDEMFELKDPQFVDVIGNYLIKCCDDGSFADLVVQKHKTLQRCMDALMERAYEMVSEDIKKTRKNTSMAILGDTVFTWAREYYLDDDREKEAERKAKADEAFRKRMEPKAATGGSKSKKTKTSKKSSVSKAPKPAKESPAAVKEKPAEKGNGQVEGQVSLFDSGFAM